MGYDLLPKQRAEASRKGWMAVGGWAASGAALVLVHSWLLAGIAAAVAVWLTIGWFRYRASWGMRF